MTLFLLVVVIAVIISGLVGFYADKVGRALGVLDYPDPVGGRKRHANITPLVGGISIVLTLTISLVLLYLLPQKNFPLETALLSWLAVIAVGMFFVGFLDDRLHLAPFPRLLISIAIFIAALSQISGFGLSFLYFSFVDKVHLLGPITALFTVICLVGLVNAVNMADGKNGLVIGMSAIWATLLYLHSPTWLSPLYAALAVSLAVLMVFNLKGKLFLGDSGSYGLAGFIGISSVYVYNQGFVNLTADQVALWYLIPVLDCLRLMISRLLVGRSPFSGDRNHLHHHLAQHFGWGWGLPIYLCLVAVPAFISYAEQSYTLALLVCVTAAYILTMIAISWRAKRTNFAAA